MEKFKFKKPTLSGIHLKHAIFFLLTRLLKSMLKLFRWIFCLQNIQCLLHFVITFLPDTLLQQMIDCYIVSMLFILLVINVIFFYLALTYEVFKYKKLSLWEHCDKNPVLKSKRVMQKQCKNDIFLCNIFLICFHLY